MSLKILALGTLGINLAYIHSMVPRPASGNEQRKLFDSLGTGVEGGVLVCAATYPWTLHQSAAIHHIQPDKAWHFVKWVIQNKPREVMSHLHHAVGVGVMRGGLIGLAYYGLYYRYSKP